MPRCLWAFILTAAVLPLLGCDRGSPSNPTAPTTSDKCGPFAPWETSELVLPYPPGTGYFLNQANCSGFGHSGFWKHGYDFRMDIGTPVSAASDGQVIFAFGDAADGDRTRTKLVAIQHADGTVTVYSHLTKNGALVEAGEVVRAGQPIGLSGDSGNTGGLPHLHFSRHPCGALPGLPGAGNCPTLPMTFRNTEPNPQGLIAGRVYFALPF